MSRKDKESMERRCRACGKGTVRPLARRGRRVRYKAVAALDVPDTVLIPTCDSCGAEWMNESVARCLDDALEVVYRRVLQEKAVAALELLIRHTSLRQIEELLGLSHGYLSKLRSGARIPSAEIVGHLALLANDPKPRLRELADLWRRAA